MELRIEYFVQLVAVVLDEVLHLEVEVGVCFFRFDTKQNKINSDQNEILSTEEMVPAEINHNVPLFGLYIATVNNF